MTRSNKYSQNGRLILKYFCVQCSLIRFKTNRRPIQRIAYLKMLQIITTDLVIIFFAWT